MGLVHLRIWMKHNYREPHLTFLDKIRIAKILREIEKEIEEKEQIERMVKYVEWRRKKREEYEERIKKLKQTTLEDFLLEKILKLEKR